MQQHKGFTLIEVMVALAVFALVGTACYQFLHSLSVSRGSLQAASEQRNSVVRAMLVIEQDMRQLIPRSVRHGDRAGRVAAISNQDEGVLEFSRGGFPKGRSIYLDAAKRVSYQLQEVEGQSVLYRVVYDALDRVEASISYRQALLSGVEDVGFRFMDEDGRWQSDWPPSNKTSEDGEGESDAGETTGDDDLSRLPDAIELALTIAPGGTVQRMISLR